MQAQVPFTKYKLPIYANRGVLCSLFNSGHFTQPLATGGPIQFSSVVSEPPESPEHPSVLRAASWYNPSAGLQVSSFVPLAAPVPAGLFCAGVLDPDDSGREVTTMKGWTRRDFFATSLAAGLLAGARRMLGAAPPGMLNDDGNDSGRLRRTAAERGAPAEVHPLIISSSNGLKHLDAGMAVLKKGGDTLDAVLAVVTAVEDDPNDDSVGYGGLPNEDGEVELDASVMHGPTHRAGSVASIRKIKNPSRVARTVMERTNHIMLVGEGALRFAVAEGFEPMNLLTERSRLAWLAWKAKTSRNWRPGLDSPEWKEQLTRLLDTPERQAWAAHIEDVVLHPSTGTINCLAVDANGDISGTTTTSGLSWKIAGRVGDSPIIGAGLYVNNDVGAAGSTGKGEENIKIAGGHTIVEMMRRGASPTEACLEALKRVAHNYNGDPRRLKQFHIQFYAVNKYGMHGGASLWQKDYNGKDNTTYAVHDGTGARLVECAFLFGGAGVVE
jgi:N4-(beta-N-acetylglucosaminyl)-L-asparaginase